MKTAAKVLALAMSALMTACGGGGDATSSTTTTSPPTTVVGGTTTGGTSTAGTTSGGTTTGSLAGGTTSGGTSGGISTGGTTTGGTTTGGSTTGPISGGTTTGGTTGGVVSKPPAPLAIAAWGDSLTAGSGLGIYTVDLAAEIGRSVSNYGVGGQTSTEVAARQGAEPALLTFKAPQLIVGVNPIAAYSTTPVTELGPGLLAGTVDGIPGTLTQVDPLKPDMVFTATAAGPVSVRVPFIPSNSDAARDLIQVLWMGRNNYFDPDTVVSDVTAAANFVRSQKVIVISVLNAESPDELAGQPHHQTIVDLNKRLAAIPGVTYIDARQWLISSYDPKQPQDVIDHQNDVPPASLRGDVVHLNAAGYKIVAHLVASAIIANGW